MGSVSTFTGGDEIFDGSRRNSDRFSDFNDPDFLGGNEVIERTKRDIKRRGTFLAGEKRGVGG